MRYEIEVTRDDIEEGHPNESLACPVARAIRREFKAGMVSVDEDEIVIGFRNDGGFTFAIETPSGVIDFIRGFDDGHDVEPFRFAINDVDGYDPEPNWETT